MVYLFAVFGLIESFLYHHCREDLFSYLDLKAVAKGSLRGLDEGKADALVQSD